MRSLTSFGHLRAGDDQRRPTRHRAIDSGPAGPDPPLPDSGTEHVRPVRSDGRLHPSAGVVHKRPEAPAAGQSERSATGGEPSQWCSMKTVLLVVLGVAAAAATPTADLSSDISLEMRECE